MSDGRGRDTLTGDPASAILDGNPHTETELSTESALDELQLRLGHTFSDPTLLELALTHRTWVEERHPGGHAPAHLSQQRLEFLGDALLNQVVGRWLYESLPTASEGELTKRRTDFTRGEWLNARGTELGVGPLVRRGRGEAANAGINRKVVEDTTEALIGAVALDAGNAVAEAMLRSWLPVEPPRQGMRDPVSVLHEWHQKLFKCAPPEPDSWSTGPDHQRTWTATLSLNGVTATANGPSLKDARRSVMRELVERLGIEA